jgi:nucleotide-binding universal stress UspA family protein
LNAMTSDWRDSIRDAACAPRPETVIVPLDRTLESLAAMPIAKLFAELEAATLHLVYVGERQQDARKTLEELGLSADELRGAVLDPMMGEPAESIVRLANELPASVIVMCTHTATSEEHGDLGSVAEAILSSAPTQIVLVAPERGQQPWRLKRVLLAHDGSPSSDVATGPAADLAHRAGAEVIALHVAARKAPQPEPGSLPAPRYVDQPQHEWPAWAGEFLQRMMTLGAPPASVNFKLLVTGGQPGSEIAQFARDNNADLVVLAWHGSWEADRAGTLKVVVRGSGCPVMLICVAK